MRNLTFVIAALLLSSNALADPAVTGQWGPIMDWGRPAVHTHVLPTGKVMWFSEFDQGDTPTLWDPATGTNSALPPAGYNIFCGGHAFLGDGLLLVAGGHVHTDVGLPYASTFNPFTNTWARLPNMNAGRWYPTNTTLPSGDMLVLSGNIDTTLGNNKLPQIWQPAAGAWRDLTTAQLELPNYPWTYALPGSKVAVVGPRADAQLLTTTGTGSWRYLATTVSHNYRDYGSSVLYEGGKALVVGGGWTPVKTAEVIDLAAATPAFRSVGSLAYARKQHNTTLLPDGKVLVTGGHSAAALDDDTAGVYVTELFDPATEQFTQLAPIGIYQGYHSTAVLLPDGRVLSAGSRYKRYAQVFSPPYLFKGARPTVTSAPTGAMWGETLHVETPNAADVAQVTLVRLSSVTHSFNMNQRFARLPFTVAAGGIDATAPASADLAPPGHYLLFILNRAGVPSVGSMLQLGGPGNVPPPPPPEQTAIAFGETWRYDARNVDPGAAWPTRAFDDSAWSSGKGQLGYGDGDEATVLPKTSPTQSSLYFRKHVSLAEAPSSASFTVVHDDGVAVYVNGTLVFSKYTGNGLAHGAWASATSADNEHSTATIPAGLLVAGDNVVAVMIKQASSASSDVSFDLSLTVSSSSAPPPAPTVTVLAPNGGESLAAGSSYTLRWSSTGTVSTVDLALSTNGGSSWSSVAQGVTNSGSYMWAVPSSPTTQARVRVTDHDSGVSDASDASFSIVGTSSTTLVAKGSVWAYRADNVDPGPGWTSASYDDSAWPTGAAQLGYGDGDEATVLPKTTPSQPSVYFRRAFDVATQRDATLAVTHDDGVAVYLNGLLVFSRYVGDLAHAAYATATSSDNQVSTVTIPAAAFVPGRNVLAVMVKQASGSSSDVSFDLALTAAGSSRAVAFGAAWRYLDTNVDPGAAWATAGFDDTAWRSGPAQLGYGDGDEATKLAKTSPSQPTVYFRRKVTLSARPSAATFTVVHDDGFVLYVNGTRAFSKYVADDAFAAYASATSGDNERTSFSIDPSLLVAGENTLAVEVKQANGSSSDVSFDLALDVQ